jgi:hypothetical protein
LYRFYEVYCEVEPKRQALEKANAELKAARDKLEIVNKQVAVCIFLISLFKRKKVKFSSSNWKKL